MAEPLRLLLVAVQFLTRVPVPAMPFGDADLRRSLGAFPLVGAVVAGVGIVVRWGAGLVWSPTVATILAVAAMLAVTGALHEDGLADTADGLGAATRTRRLEIMRDPRLGAYGVVALFVVVGLRVALLTPLPVLAFARALLLAHVVGQAGTLVAVRGRQAVPDSSARPLTGGPGPVAALVAGLTLLAAVVAAGPWGVVAAGAGLGAAVLVAGACIRAFGGLNGDMLGAVNQVGHLVALATLVAVLAPVR